MSDSLQPPKGPQPRPHEPETHVRAVEYVRFVALGDSASCGVGDPTPQGLRGWAQILTDAIAAQHHVSFCKLAVPGAVVADVRRKQLADALAHRPVVASLIVGLNDVLRSTWDPDQIRTDLMFCAEALARQGTLLVTVRFHDHTRVFGLPRLLARRLQRRIDVLNEIYDEVHDTYGTLRLDLAADREIYNRRLWSFDRLHPSEQGHRRLAHQIAAMLNAEGLTFPLPSLTATSALPSRTDNVRTFAADIVPWLARRLLELTPRAVGGFVCRMEARHR